MTRAAKSRTASSQEERGVAVSKNKTKVAVPEGQPYPMNAKGQRVCGAKTKSGKPCQSTVLYPNGRCHLHGGPTPTGMNAPRWKHGRYSQYMPKNLLQDYERMLENDDLLTLRDEIALIDALIANRLRELPTGEAGALWLEVKDKFQAMRRAMLVQDQQRSAQLFDELSVMLSEGADHAHARRELLDLLERRRKLVDSERKALTDMGLMMTTAQLAGVIAELVVILEEHIVERPVLFAVRDAIQKRILGRTSQPLERIGAGRGETHQLSG